MDNHANSAEVSMSEILDQQHLETQQAVDDLRQGVKSVIEHAVQAYRKELKVYQSLQNLNEVIGTEYGNRVIYELIQNAHDAHQSDECGCIAVSLCLVNASQGTLYIAPDGLVDLWCRAGGYSEQLIRTGTPASQWLAAVRLADQGALPHNVSSLLHVLKEIVPHNQKIKSMLLQLKK